MATVTPIDEASFPQTVLAGSQPVLVEFTAEWCPPCKRLAPVLAELSMEYAVGKALRRGIKHLPESLKRFSPRAA